MLAVLTILSAGPGFAQTSEELSAVRKEIQAIKEGQTAIQKELQETKDLMRARQVREKLPQIERHYLKRGYTK